jgi:predicted RNA-binding Zn ribbon-like protein
MDTFAYRSEPRRGAGGLRTAMLAAVPVIARNAGELLISEDLRAVKSCPGDDCGWMFIDTRER